jgi:hypothetical protein
MIAEDAFKKTLAIIGIFIGGDTGTAHVNPAARYAGGID